MEHQQIRKPPDSIHHIVEPLMHQEREIIEIPPILHDLIREFKRRVQPEDVRHILPGPILWSGAKVRSLSGMEGWDGRIHVLNSIIMIIIIHLLGLAPAGYLTHRTTARSAGCGMLNSCNGARNELINLGGSVWVGLGAKSDLA
jgi:hypothetical protein